MSEIGKIELDDDVLDKVSGGATTNSTSGCKSCVRVNKSLPESCDNCVKNSFCTLK